MTQKNHKRTVQYRGVQSAPEDFKNIRLNPDVSLTVWHLLDNYRAEDLFRTCISCMFFDDKNDFCRKAKAKPPAFIIVRSCEAYSDKDDIPF